MSSERLAAPNAISPEERAARRWLGLAMLVLVAAGTFALAVVVGRMPPFDRFVTDPLFFKRCLVAHVNLALVAWFYSFVAALSFVLPAAGESSRLSRASVYVASLGVGLMLVGAAVPDARPFLSNYIPTIDHWTFRAGQLAFGIGALLSFLDGRLLPRSVETHTVESHPLRVPPAVRSGLRATAAALVLAAATFVVTWFHQPAGAPAEVHYDLLVWGGGHVLQLACATAMVSCWLLLLDSALGASPVSARAAACLFAALIIPWITAPAFALEGTWSGASRSAFTQLMQWGIFPVVSIFLVLCASSLRRALREGKIGARDLTDPRIAAFLVSATMTVLGFVLGAAIRGSSTMVPAHYHASVGGVTVAFMAVAYLLLERLGLPLRSARQQRAARWQPVLYGGGMAVFAAGFALAGAHGMGRKIYGAEQASRGLAETIGLLGMGLGGFVAIAGGLLFLGVVASAWWPRARARNRSEAELAKSSWRWA